MRDLWHSFLVFLHLRIDYTNPDNAPPFDNDMPHPFVVFDGDPVMCKRCLGGKNHPIHHGKQYTQDRAGVLSEESKAIIERAPER